MEIKTVAKVTSKNNQPQQKIAKLQETVASLPKR